MLVGVIGVFAPILPGVPLAWFRLRFSLKMPVLILFAELKNDF